MIETFSDRQQNQQSRAAQIESIIKKRQPLGDRIETVQNNLNNLSNLLQIVEAKRKNLLEKADDVTTLTKLETINFFGNIEQIITNTFSNIASFFSTIHLFVLVKNR